MKRTTKSTPAKPKEATPKKVSVKKGQHWTDNDSRNKGKRVVEIRAIVDGHAIIKQVSKSLRSTGERNLSVAKLDRFNGKSNGYTLITTKVKK